MSNNRLPVSGLGVEVGIYNGTSTPHLARAPASQLQQVGFTVNRVVDGGPADVTTTTIRYGAGHHTDARTLATFFPRARLLPTGGAGAAGVTLVLGRDYAARTTTAETPPTSVPAVRPRTASDNPCEDLSYGPPVPTR
ncbi:LytR C-terminal domain-containing protein [Actinopolymorpha singaporensis]|uniref:LytR C-terminal domain-containing protein n=1 Tax=Actinopolymorpha singaporensis TaxID=117157 RepID=UPI0012FE2EC9|nr:LytR C-terminal domain-containing protein [Actinopolymorpha singaporensis]